MKEFWLIKINYNLLIKKREFFFFTKEYEVSFDQDLPEYFLAHDKKSAKNLVFYSDWWRNDICESLSIKTLFKNIVGCELLDKTLTAEKVKKISLFDMIANRISNEDFMSYVIERLER